MSALLVVGAGGHGRVVADAAEETGAWTRIAFVDDRHPELASSGEWPVIGSVECADQWVEEYSSAVVAIGDNRTRLRCARRFAEMGYRLATVIHPAAYVGRRVELGLGSVLMAQATVNTGACVGAACILNTASVVEHDCLLGDGVHVSPGAALAGGVRVGECAWVGIGASVRQDVRIGGDAVVAAGAAVVRDVAEGRTAVGIPARLLRLGNEGAELNE